MIVMHVLNFVCVYIWCCFTISKIVPMLTGHPKNGHHFAVNIGITMTMLLILHLVAALLNKALI